MEKKSVNTNKGKRKEKIWEKKGLYILVPCIALLLTLANQIIIFILYSVQIERIVNSEQGIQTLLESVQRYLNYSESNAISTVLGLFATVVSVWVSLSIYNIVEKKDVEKTRTEVQELDRQFESLMNNYSTFNIGSLKYIKVWEDRVNGFYTDRIWEILKSKKYPAYEIATAMVRIENILNCIVERFNNESFYQMKSFLERYHKEVKDLTQHINHLYIEGFLTKKEERLLDSYTSCREAEYFYYLYFRDKHYKKNTADTHLDSACKKFERALKLCPEANQKSNGYMDNAIAVLYFQKYQRNKEDMSLSFQYIEKALNYSKRAAAFDSHYDRNYRNYGVNLEAYAKARGAGNREALLLAKKQYEKALSCDKHSYNNYIAYVSCSLKLLDLNFHIDERVDRIEQGLSEKATDTTQEILDEMVLCYGYLTLAILNKPIDPQAHYHMIHVLMYLYMCALNHLPVAFNEQEIKEKAISSMANCESIYMISANKRASIAYLFKSRNFYETLSDYKKAEQFNNRILEINDDSQDAKTLKEFYANKLQ